MTPETNAELAQIHFIVEKERDWQAPLAEAEKALKRGALDEGHALLRAHAKTIDSMLTRLGDLIATEQTATTAA